MRSWPRSLTKSLLELSQLNDRRWPSRQARRISVNARGELLGAISGIGCLHQQQVNCGGSRAHPAPAV